MKLKSIILLSLLTFCAFSLFAQTDRKHNREAMKSMADGNFSDAIINFQKAIKENPNQVAYQKNLGHSHYRNEDYENAASDYKLYGDKSGLSQADQYYNLGNAYLQAGEYDKGIESYINSLKLDPNSTETKYNLSMAHAMKKQEEQRQQQQQQQDDNENKDNKDENKNQDKNDKEDQEKEDQENNEDKNEDNQDNKNDKENKQQQQPQPQELSKEDADRMLEALQKKEEDLQDKQKKEVNIRIRQPEKDW